MCSKGLVCLSTIIPGASLFFFVSFLVPNGVFISLPPPHYHLLYTYTKRDPRASGSTATHEGIHRGITELVDAKEERAYSLLDKANNLRQELSQKKSVTKKELDELDRLEAEALSNLNQRNKIKGVDPRVSDQSFDQNELAVRGLMQKFYGDVEKRGTLVAPPQLYEGGAQFLAQNPDLISTIEQMATEELKRRGRPMGPR